MGFFYILQTLTLLLALSSPRQVHGNTELKALMELKSVLDPTDKILSSWTSNGDPCSGLFEGVACNEHRKVANISLQGKGLSGKLSPALAELKCLSGLYLHFNSISGEVPKEIGNLTELSDLYLDVNNLTGSIPMEIGGMASLQVLQLCCNQLTGNVPRQIGSLKKVSVIALQYNKLTAQIPSILENLVMLRRLDLGFNHFLGSIPPGIAVLPQLEVLDVRNNSLSGIIPSALKRLGDGFQFENNQGLCGDGFPTLRACTALDGMNINQVDPSDPTAKTIPESAIVPENCNHASCPRSSKLPRVAIIAGVIAGMVTLVIVGSLFIFRYRRQKQKIGDTVESSDGRLSIDQTKEFSRSGASPLLSLAYSSGWDPLGDCLNVIESAENHLTNFRFNLEDIESATLCFSEANLLGKSSFSSVYKGILRDGSLVAIRSISLTSCKSEEAEFVWGLDLLTSLRHDNLARMRGFCFSRGRGECFLIYDFAPKGSLSKYLDLEDGSHQVLDWPSRVSIIKGIAKGIGYLHSSDSNDKPVIIHRSISVDKVLLDHQFNPLIADSGLSKILADDFVFSAIKVSAAMGYLAPEYVTTGHFTQKSDMYAFGVIILQILSGKQMLSNSMRQAAQSCIYENFIDRNLRGNFSESEAAKLAKIALDSTNELPELRPNIEVVIQVLENQREF